MSDDATIPSTPRMDCSTVAREEIVERYLGGGLTEQERSAFEEHYIGCEQCFEELRVVHAIRAEIESTGARFEPAPAPKLRWLVPAGAAAAVLVAAVLWLYPPVPSRPGQVSTSAALPAREAGNPGATPPHQPAPRESIEQLARFEPPSYQVPTLRGASDKATVQFLRGMERYQKGDYAGAVLNLRAAADLDATAPHTLFFLGISHLMLSQEAAAVDRLQAAVALGDSAYQEEARLYLARAFLRLNDLAAAEQQLQTLVERRGPASEEARQLLTRIQRIRNRSD